MSTQVWIAQWLERQAENLKAVGSNPISNIMAYLFIAFWLFFDLNWFLSPFSFWKFITDDDLNTLDDLMDFVQFILYLNEFSGNQPFCWEQLIWIIVISITMCIIYIIFALSGDVKYHHYMGISLDTSWWITEMYAILESVSVLEILLLPLGILKSSLFVLFKTFLSYDIFTPHALVHYTGHIYWSTLTITQILLILYKCYYLLHFFIVLFAIYLLNKVFSYLTYNWGFFVKSTKTLLSNFLEMCDLNFNLVVIFKILPNLKVWYRPFNLDLNKGYRQILNINYFSLKSLFADLKLKLFLIFFDLFNVLYTNFPTLVKLLRGLVWKPLFKKISYFGIYNSFKNKY